MATLIQTIMRKITTTTAKKTTTHQSNNKIPLLVIIGATGTGKTKLGIELAKKLNGEVVNADSLQMYQGLSIVTAKPDAKEMDGVPHHLMSFLPPTKVFTAHDFCKEAVPVIEDIHKRGKVPIVVGGTLYYVQSLLWDSLINHGNSNFEEKIMNHAKEMTTIISNEDSITSNDDNNNNNNMNKSTPSNTISNNVNKSNNNNKNDNLWEKLKSIDPVMAERLHPNNIRKIERSIEIFETSGQRHSDLIDLQVSKGGGIGGNSPYDYRMLWLHCEKETHDIRLNDRIDKMLLTGLEKEIRDLQRIILKDIEEYERNDNNNNNNSGNNNNNTYEYHMNQGVLQAIGFKEFNSYLKLCQNKTETEIELMNQTGMSKAYENALHEGTDALRIQTRRYAKRQLKWIKNRFIKRGIPVYMFDTTTYKTTWNDVVSTPALQIAKSLINSNEEGDDDDQGEEEDENNITNIMNDRLNAAKEVFGNPKIHNIDPTLKWKKIYCEICETELDGQLEYEVHLKTKWHKSMKNKLKKRKLSIQQDEKGSK